MKFDKKLMAALVAASVCCTGTLIADDKEKVKVNEPAGAEAQVETSDSAVEADAAIEIDEPAGAEVSTDTQVETDTDTEVDEAAGAESDKPEHQFVKKAAQSGMAEVKMGELAAQKAESSSVKQFGDRLAKDHQQANDKLKKIAEQKGITLSEETKGKHAKTLEHLGSLSGAEFDQAFIKHAVEDHEKGIREFEKHAREGEDPAIRSFASEVVPTLREHLRIAKMLQEDRNASIPDINEPAGAQPDAQQELDPQAEPPQIEEQPDDAAGAQPSPTDDSNSQQP
jgi:putative membrane protein